jgi:hypothetical protein
MNEFRMTQQISTILSPDIFARLLDMGLRLAFDEVELLPGAGIHNEVLWLADGGLRSLQRFFETISVADRPGFIKALAVFENTVGGLGSVTTLEKLLPLVDDDGGELLDWIVRNTQSYWYYSNKASSLDEMNEIRREHQRRRARAFSDDAESYDETLNRYRGLVGGSNLSLYDATAPGLVVKPDVAVSQIEAEQALLNAPGQSQEPGSTGTDHIHPVQPGGISDPAPPAAVQLRRFHGTAFLDPARVGCDASQIADVVVAHLVGLIGAKVTATLEIEAEIPTGAPDNIVRTVTENSRTLKFTSAGFEQE